MFAGTAIVMLGNYYGYDSIAPVAEQLSHELHYSDTQIGTLNAIYSLPNIFLVLVGGVLVDRFSARAMVLATTALCLVGAVVTALGAHFPVMAVGRLLFGIGSETLVVAVTVALAQWFTGRYFALLFALNLSLARLGSYLADRSPSFAGELYARGWQPPLWLAAGFAAASFAGALLYFYVDRREAPRGTLTLPPPPDRIDWRHLLTFRSEYWLLVAVCVTFYSVIFPFRSTFAIKYLQEAQGYTLDQASTLNSYVFLAAVFATPAFGFLLDRIGRNARDARRGRGTVAAELPGARHGQRRGRPVHRAARRQLLVPAGGAVADGRALRAARTPRHGLRPDDDAAERRTIRGERRGRLHQRRQRSERRQPRRLRHPCCGSSAC